MSWLCDVKLFLPNFNLLGSKKTQEDSVKMALVTTAFFRYNKIVRIDQRKGCFHMSVENIKNKEPKYCQRNARFVMAESLRLVRRVIRIFPKLR